jgi:arginase family enzyme
MPEKIRIIGVPMDLGASRRGVDMGPSALRVAGLQARLKQLGRQVEDMKFRRRAKAWPMRLRKPWMRT